MRKTIANAALIGCLWRIPSAFAQQDIISFSSVTTSRSDPDENTYGFEFTVTSSITVIGLSAFDATPSGGMSLAAPVGLWNSSGTLLDSGTVAAGTVDPLTSDGSFRYVLLPTPLVLGDGNYYVGAPDAADALTVSGMTSVSGVNYIGAAYYDHGGLNFPSEVMSGTSGYFGGDVVVAPEAPPGLLLELGLIGMAFLGCWQTKPEMRQP